MGAWIFFEGVSVSRLKKFVDRKIVKQLYDRHFALPPHPDDVELATNRFLRGLLDNLVNEEEYTQLMKLKRVRNRVVHKLYVPSTEEIKEVEESEEIPSLTYRQIKRQCLTNTLAFFIRPLYFFGYY